MNRPVLQLRPPKDYLPETSSSHLKVGGWKVILSFSGPAIHGLFSSAMLILGSVWLGHVTRPQPTNPGWVNLFRPNRLLRFNWVGCKTLLLHQKCFKKRMPSLKLAWLVVSTPLKNNSQNGFIFPKFRGENKKYLSCHRPVRPFALEHKTSQREIVSHLSTHQFLGANRWFQQGITPDGIGQVSIPPWDRAVTHRQFVLFHLSCFLHLTDLIPFYWLLWFTMIFHFRDEFP